MSQWGDTTVVEIGGIPRDIDTCLVPLIKALNDAGVPTVACCCGHGKGLGDIALADGRELIIAGSWDEARGLFTLESRYSALEKASRPALEVLQLFATESDRDIDAPSIPEVIDALAAALDALPLQQQERT